MDVLRTRRITREVERLHLESHLVPGRSPGGGGVARVHGRGPRPPAEWWRWRRRRRRRRQQQMLQASRHWAAKRGCARVRAPLCWQACEQLLWPKGHLFRFVQCHHARQVPAAVEQETRAPDHTVLTVVRPVELDVVHAAEKATRRRPRTDLDVVHQPGADLIGDDIALFEQRGEMMLASSKVFLERCRCGSIRQARHGY